MKELDLNFEYVSAPYRPFAHYNEAASFNCTNMFIIWESFGPNSVFYTVTPRDNTLVRIRPYLFAGASHKFQSMNWADEKCVTYLNFRKNYCVAYVGAFVIKFNYIIHIVVE